MKLIRTLAHSFDLDRVIESLDREGFHGVTIAEIVHRDSSREGRAHVTLRNQVTLALHDDRVARALSALRQAGCKRDLEVVIEPLAGAVRIRTGEIDEAAIWQ